MQMRRHRPTDAGPDETFELAALADDTLSSEQRSQLEARVHASPELSERLAEQQEALALVRSAVAEVQAPPGLRRRIEAQQRPQRSHATRRFAIAGAGALAAAIAATAVVTFSGGGSNPGFRAALAPTGLAPAARGEATLTRRPSGWRIELTATGLPRLANGAFYEAWLRNAAGVLVPIGTFNDGRSVTLWAGVRPTQFTTLTVTRERADGDQRSSGEKVLVGTVTRGS